MRARRVVASALIAVVCAASPSGATTTPLFTVPRAELAAATHCDASLTAGTAKRAVLLVHGTGATPEEAWGWNYQIALRRLGYGICTVRLPDRGFANLYTSAQYVAYAARAAYRVSSRRIAILGHSQGGLLSVWVAKFWPDIARRASDVITLAAPVHGTRLANTLCATRLCATAAWQQRAGSDLVRSLANKAKPRTTAFTSIGTAQDETVYPQPRASTVRMGSTILVQQVCPGRVVDHGLLLSDAVAYRLVLDALQHAGPAQPDRISSGACTHATLPGTDFTAAAGFAQTIVALALGLANPLTFVTAEPALPPYARPYLNQ